MSDSHYSTMISNEYEEASSLSSLPNNISHKRRLNEKTSIEKDDITNPNIILIQTDTNPNEYHAVAYSTKDASKIETTLIEYRDQPSYHREEEETEDSFSGPLSDILDSWICCCQAIPLHEGGAMTTPMHTSSTQAHASLPATTIPNTITEVRDNSPSTTSNLLPMQFEIYKTSFESNVDTNRIQLHYLTTYQGRIPQSSNGCAVIAPLLAVQYFHYTTDDSLPNGSIEEVIDIQAPILLPEVRTMLGLPVDALIIPSDVHDYFLENGLLTQENFWGVCGGNILDPTHLDSLFQLLTPSTTHTTYPTPKFAATFYFHEHVISILYSPTSHYYEVIDSLPQWTDIIHQCPITPGALRIRCLDREALRHTLLWYTSQKFTLENQTFVSMYDWDEKHPDLDPRVFQAFVWMSN